jgi:hypothetical protein
MGMVTAFRNIALRQVVEDDLPFLFRLCADLPQGGTPVTARKEGHFQVVRLEERIAPRRAGKDRGHGGIRALHAAR